MSTAVYFKGIRGEENLSVYNHGTSLYQIEEDLVRILQENDVIIESFMVSTTQSDRWYDEVSNLLAALADWSNE